MRTARQTCADALVRAFGLDRTTIASLRRYAAILHRWCEAECGDSGPNYSWAIERDEQTQIPYRVVYPHRGESYRTQIRDAERIALAGVERICKAHDLQFFYQTDPRGASLYIAREPLTDSDYTRGVAVY